MSIAQITGAKLPEQEIDGKSVWDVWTGKAHKSPQKAYYFYYHKNELHGIRYGKWKLYFPHKYRTLNGRKGGENGLPVAYEYNTFDTIELYDLSNDLGESNDVAAAHPQVVEEILLLGNDIRIELGDQLTNTVGVGNRSIGKID